MPVVVVTDSSACITSDVARRLGIAVAPLHVFVNGTDLREGVDDIADHVVAGSGVSTSGASPGELLEIYRRALAKSEGAGVVAVHISRGLSSTWEAARHAADGVGDGVRLVDSASAGMGLGYAALGAATAAASGADLDTVYDTAVDIASSCRCFIVVDRLDHLRRGGRIGTAAALLGTALAMKPVLHLDEGKLVLREKARTSAKALRKLVEAAQSAAGESGVALTVHHMQCPDRAAELETQLREAIPQVDAVTIAPFGAVLGVHVGPGAVGVVVAVRPPGDASTE